MQDPLLTKLLCEDSDIIRGIHEHDTLLEHKEEEELEEMEKNNAWSEYKKSNDFDGELELKLILFSSNYFVS